MDWTLCFISITSLLCIYWAQTQFQRGSTAANLLFILPWALIAVRNPHAALGGLRAYWPVLALPVFAVLSAAWSDYPGSSLRGGGQYLATAIIGVLAGTCIKPRTMLWSLLSALGFVTAIGVVGGVSTHWGDVVTLVGLFGSKNYFGLSVALLLLTAMALALKKSQLDLLRGIALAIAMLGPLFLVQSRSIGALVCSVAAAAVACLCVFIARFAPHVRAAIVVLIAPLIGVLLIVWSYLGDTSEVLNSLGKDATLSGRTWLWEWANLAIVERPILGFGYQAFWQPGNWGAEEIWFHDQHTDKTGYHFHNTFLQVAVDLGYVGLFVLLATIVAICARIARCVIFYRLEAEQIFAIAVFLFLLFRLPIEVDLFWQFQLPTVVLSLIWIYLGRPQRQPIRRPRAPMAGREIISLSGRRYTCLTT